MARKAFKRLTWLLSIFIYITGIAAAQTPPPSSSLDESGSILVDAKPVPYAIRHLPVSSFPDLPLEVRAALESRGCLIPQTYEAHRPENVVRASFEKAGSTDWAALCSVDRTASLMVFFGSAPSKPFVVASGPETEHLQRNTVTGIFGFNWAIDPAPPQRIHDASVGRRPHPMVIDHDALADSWIDRRTVYHFYANNAWTLLDLPEK
jgi:hypothetical protein